VEVTVEHAVSNRLKLVVGDITKLTVDAVVTAANEALCGGGVDGAIQYSTSRQLTCVEQQRRRPQAVG
jgi:O-acetyl-ADP-ribose deacetylase (regulator of RNase III)